MAHPYKNRPARHFWRHFVGGEHEGLYRQKFDILPEDRIAAAGSCFAQHVARNLRLNGYSVLDVEPPPAGLSPERYSQYDYGLFSARYGNIYTTRHLLQLAHEAVKGPQRNTVWERDGRYYDAFRPNIEPGGFASPDEVRAHRAAHLAAVRRMLRTMDVFVFTFGLTESWTNADGTEVYPLAPGTTAGSYDPDAYRFLNQSPEGILADFEAFMALVGRDVRYLVTVSPVPLIATASEDHVLSANTFSKATLRTVAGMLANKHDNVAYFPSYEIITSPLNRGAFYEADMRGIAPEGVATVMKTFFAHHPPQGASASVPEDGDVLDQKCDEEVLEAFA